MKFGREAIIVGIAVLGVILAGGIYVFMWPNAKEVQDLHVSLVRLQVADEHGTSLPQISDLLFDARTKFELAKPRMFGWDVKKCKAALDAVDDVETVWRDTLNGDYGVELYDPMLTLGIVHSNAEFKKIQSEVAKRKPNVGDSPEMLDLDLKIQIARSRVYVDLALRGLSAKLAPAVVATE
jgi:hypothetical protein